MAIRFSFVGWGHDPAAKPSPLGVVLRAANLVIAMIAGGNHTLIHRGTASAVDVGCHGFVSELSERAEKLRPHISQLR